MLKLVARMLKLFAALSSMLQRTQNYFNGPTKLFSDLYLAKFLDASAKPFFPCKLIVESQSEPKRFSSEIRQVSETKSTI